VFQPFTGTSWYSFTPSESQSVMVTRIGCCANGHNIGVYKGGSVDALTSVAVARPFDGRAIFSATAGTTYRIQNGVNGFPFGGQVGLQIEKTPSPVVASYWSIGDPSIYDTVAFGFNGYDPAGVGIDSFSWAFGDGAVQTGPNVSHRFAADGDYEVRLTITTPDGRTAVEKRTMSVRTHDVAIVKLAVPQSGRVGQTKTISVNVANKREAETVTVTLFRSVPGTSGGWEAVAQSTQTLPAKSGNKTTSYVFSYTFTAADASVGKVSFRASASINGARDALPADNESVSPPASVSP
jgi:PKD repeat protein